MKSIEALFNAWQRGSEWRTAHCTGRSCFRWMAQAWKEMINDIYFPQFPDEKACNKDLTDVWWDRLIFWQYLRNGDKDYAEIWWTITIWYT